MSHDHPSLAAQLSRAVRDREGALGPTATMEMAVRMAERNVRDCHAAAISLAHRRGRVHTRAYTHDAALGGDLLQYTLGEGPCLAGAWEERIVHSADLSSDARWPTWGPRVAADHGMHSLLCFQLFTLGESLGALSLYSRRAGAFDQEARDDGFALASHIAVAVAAAQNAAQNTEQLSHAVDSRTLIGQAVGIVMERYRLEPAAAFHVLTQVSAQTDARVRDVARELVCTGRLPGTPDPSAPTSSAPSSSAPSSPATSIPGPTPKRSAGSDTPDRRQS